MVTEGRPIQELIGDDPIFSAGGELAFNWLNSNNCVGVVLTGGYLSSVVLCNMARARRDNNWQETSGFIYILESGRFYPFTRLFRPGDPALEAKIRKYRKKAAKLPGQFFEIEMAMARRLGKWGKKKRKIPLKK